MKTEHRSEDRGGSLKNISEWRNVEGAGTLSRVSLSRDSSLSLASAWARRSSVCPFSLPASASASASSALALSLRAASSSASAWVLRTALSCAVT